MSHTLDESRIKETIDNLLDNTTLTKWELSFLESISEQYDSSGHLSEKQLETLERIHIKH